MWGGERRDCQIARKEGLKREFIVYNLNVTICLKWVDSWCGIPKKEAKDREAISRAPQKECKIGPFCLAKISILVNEENRNNVAII